MKFLFLSAVASLLFIAAKAIAQGGPPLLTDDPDPVGNNRWEINIAATVQATSESQWYELPHVDFNYGLGDSIHLKWETGLAAASGHGLQLGWEDSLIGVKWRIRNGGDEGFTLGTYPQLGFRLFSSNNPRLAGPSTYAILPVEAKYGFGPLAIDGEVGLLLNPGAPSGGMYGVCAGYEFTARLELLAEIHGTIGNSPIFPPGLIGQVGVHAGVNEWLAVIASLGATVLVPAGDPTTWLSFAGIQLSL